MQGLLWNAGFILCFKNRRWPLLIFDFLMTYLQSHDNGIFEYNLFLYRIGSAHLLLHLTYGEQIEPKVNVLKVW